MHWGKKPKVLCFDLQIKLKISNFKYLHLSTTYGYILLET